ncbi:MAG: type II secretion system protein [Clostridia bacterium]|nr:type II secretion system protein [Clostridia bacterium]
MSDRRNGLFQKVKARKGMTLVEVLVALTLLSLIILVFTPLFMNYYRNIHTAGDITRTTYKRTSLMERLVANAGNANDTGYETHVSNVPIILKNANNQSISVSFPLSDRDNVVEGNIISENNNTPNSYATFYTRPLSNGMVCFPAQLTDDFIKKDIVVVPKGFNFNSKAYNKAETGAYNFKVYNTDSSGVLQLVPTSYYDIRSTDQGTATFTFYGGNDVISFEHSPLWIAYCDGENAEYRVKVEISAPEIILVGEKPVGKNDYYYYATAGVDLTTAHYGEMDIVAKKMSGAPLTSAMNDVEWVEKGKGDNGSGGVNQYGYYVMGGDAGQVRRFWRNETTGNYYWGGDNLNNYNRYVYLSDSGGLKEGFENFNRQLTTQANFKSVFRSDANLVSSSKTGGNVNAIMTSSKISLFKYEAITTNYFTANVTNDDTYYMTIGNVVNAKWKNNIFSSVTNRKANGANSDFDFDGAAQTQWTWFTGDNTQNTKLNVAGYKEATGYEYPSDNSLITITSVGAIQIDKNNTNYYQTQGNSTVNNNVYPTQSYTLYCGYIPAVTDIYGWKTSTLYWKGYIPVATLGAAYSSVTGKFYPTGKYGDIFTTSSALQSSVMGNLAYTSLLRWKNDDNYPSAPSNPGAGKWNANVWAAGSNENPGLLLPAQGNDYYTSGGHEVDISMGYLSEPFAISIRDPEVPSISGISGSDYYFEKFNSASGKFDHSFFSGGLRDNVTLLDIKSFHDDITGNNISMGVGYTLSYMIADYSYATRMQQAYNTGIVYIRATGDGNDNDTTGSLDSGKGWSLGKETNVFHQFFGTDQYQGNNGGIFSKDGTNAMYGWDTTYHRTYLNISSSDSKAPQSGYSPNFNSGNSNYGVNCHPLMDTQCTTVNWGSTWDEKPQAMWGTANGTLISWFYDYESRDNSKITSVLKEFENFRWADRIGSNARQNQFYDYNSVKAGNQSTYGFVSVLSSINDVAFSDGIWVAVGNQATTSEYGKENETLNEKKPSDYCASAACYTQDGSAGSYVNVKYKNANGVTQWKAVRISTDKNINIRSVVNCQGVWYIMGYVDKDRDGKNDANEPCVMFFSTHPEQEWNRCRTRQADGSYTAANSNNLTNTKSYAVYYEDGSIKEMELGGINKMASQG